MVKFILGQTMKAQKESGYIPNFSLTLTLDGDGRSTPRLGRFTPRKGDPKPIVQEAGPDPRLACASAENLLVPYPIPALRFDPPGRPTRNESLSWPTLLWYARKGCCLFKKKNASFALSTNFYEIIWYSQELD